MDIHFLVECFGWVVIAVIAFLFAIIVVVVCWAKLISDRGLCGIRLFRGGYQPRCGDLPELPEPPRGGTGESDKVKRMVEGWKAGRS
jgi:hypothetical protein